jgi:RNA polymerase sigma factor (sigma-70 family)
VVAAEPRRQRGIAARVSHPGPPTSESLSSGRNARIANPTFQSLFSAAIKGGYQPRLSDNAMQRIGTPDHLPAVDAAESARITPEPLHHARETYDLRFAELRNYLVAVCRSLIGDDAEDVVQDTYLIGRARLPQLRNADSIHSWLTAIAINECYRRHRRRQRLSELLAAFRPAESEPSDPDLRAAVQALPFRDRTVVVLHYGHGLSLEEIGQLLGTPPATIRSVLFRVRQRLRGQFTTSTSTKSTGDPHD